MIETSQIREHMHVHSSDGEHVGRVDHVKGDTIELAKMDLATMGQHHYIPLSWVDRVDDDKVHLSITKDEAKARWA
ncbi:MAG: DUF2171 domain-containing protein [Pseudomonadota bacterium]|jgi:hypothetical protein|nr:DUF2171 domain-containing protein [Pseudomonadota bacterium]